MAEPTSGQARPPPPPSSYPASHSYPSPSMQSYQYPPSQSHQSNDGYRRSPTAGNVTLPSINLPPLRGLDTQSPPQPPPPQQHGGSTLPPPPSVYYPQHGQSSMAHSGQGMGMGGPPHLMRYALPSAGPDARLLSGGRHKKEIKRRTKSGCLTCRKRRIKCDEQHPKCRNCIKSKRDCLGYDPIFKQQQGPQQLQPAPSSAQTLPSSSATAGAQSPHPPYQPPPPASSYHPPPPHQNTAVKSESSNPEGYGSPIDPALATGASKPGMASSSNQLPHPGPPPSGPIEMEHLFFASGYRAPDVPFSSQPLEGPALDEIKAMYLNTFAPGLNAVLETTWYSTTGVGALMVDGEMCKFMAELIRRYNTVGQGSDFALESQCRAMETKAVWKLLSLCRTQPPTTTPPTAAAIDLDEVCRRLDVLESLLKKTVLPSNPFANFTPSSSSTNESGTQDKRQESQFWTMAGDFVSTSPLTSEGLSRLDTLLASARVSLSRIEIRDIIYSIMVTRHVGRGMHGFPDNIAARPGGEEEPANKVIIARDFIRKEANWQGTSHPIQRVCDMAVRSWSLR